MVMDDVDLCRLVENIRYLAKRANIDNQLQDRVLNCMDAFDALINCDINIAYQLARDLTIVRALIKKESEDLDRKFTIFEKKLRKVADTIAPKETAEEGEVVKSLHPEMILFQDYDIRIIDNASKKNAMNKMNEARELLRVIKEILKIADSPNLTLSVKNDVNCRMKEVINLLRIDGILALKLNKDILDIKAAQLKGKEGIPELDNKLKIIKLKLLKCLEEVDNREGEYGKIIQQFDDLTLKAMEYLDESLKGYDNRRLKHYSRGAKEKQEWLTTGYRTQHPYSVDRPSIVSTFGGQSPTMPPTTEQYSSVPGPPGLPYEQRTSSFISQGFGSQQYRPQMGMMPPAPLPTNQGWILVPIDPTMCPALNYPETRANFYSGTYPISLRDKKKNVMRVNT